MYAGFLIFCQIAILKILKVSYSNLWLRFCILDSFLMISSFFILVSLCQSFTLLLVASISCLRNPSPCTSNELFFYIVFSLKNVNIAFHISAFKCIWNWLFCIMWIRISVKFLFHIKTQFFLSTIIDRSVLSITCGITVSGFHLWVDLFLPLLFCSVGEFDYPCVNAIYF